MNGAELPTTIIGLASLVIVTVGGLIHLRWQQRTTSQQISEVHRQVRNDHPESPNLRDDMDDIRAIVRDIQDHTIGQGRDLTAIRVDVSGVRHELHDEIDRSKSADKQIANELRDERRRSIIADTDLARRVDQCSERDTE